MRIWSCVVFVSYGGGCSWSGRWGGARAGNEITTQECVAALGVDNETVADYADGLLATETVFDNDPAYTYRGTDPNIITAHPDRTALGTSPRYHKKRGSD